jgi:hypothetical protein
MISWCKLALICCILLLCFSYATSALTYTLDASENNKSGATVKIKGDSTLSDKKLHRKSNPEFVATGERSDQLIKNKPRSSKSSWDRYKMKLPFWPRKAVIFLELGIIIILGIFIGQILEELGIIKALGFLTWPISFLGKLPQSTSPAFLFALQSGAIANSMLVAQRDNNQITNRELYTSVFVVSSISLLAHLPTFVVPMGMAFGWKAAGAFFSVRLAAIAVQVVTILLVSQFIFLKRSQTNSIITQPSKDTQPQRKWSVSEFFKKVWKKSNKSIKRLLMYLLPTFFATAILEQSGFFEWIGKYISTIPIINIFPAQASVIIAAQAINLYNGAIMAASFIDSNAITVRDAVLILLTGSLITAPIRTLKHSIGSYITILGARPGIIMAISTQFTRCLFLLFATIICAFIWR